MSRIWTVVLVRDNSVVNIEEHITAMSGVDECYKQISEIVGSDNRVIAMIPGNHVTGSKVYPMKSVVSNRKTSHIDPFDTPTSF